MMVRLVGVPASDVAAVWPVVFKHLEKPIAMTGGRYSPASVLDALLNKNMQLWIAVEKQVLAALITQIGIYPTGEKALVALLIGGRGVNDWVHLWPQIEQWGRAAGCRYAEIPSGRKGWKKLLKGWNTMTFMEKEL